MFAPIEFTPFSAIFPDLHEAVSAAWTNETMRRYGSEEIQKGDYRAKKWLCTRNVLSAWLTAKALQSFRLYISSPQGAVMQIQNSVCNHRDRLDWYDWEWPDENGFMGEMTLALDRFCHQNTDPLTRLQTH